MRHALDRRLSRGHNTTNVYRGSQCRSTHAAPRLQTGRGPLQWAFLRAAGAAGVSLTLIHSDLSFGQFVRTRSSAGERVCRAGGYLDELSEKQSAPEQRPPPGLLAITML